MAAQCAGEAIAAKASPAVSALGNDSEENNLDYLPPLFAKEECLMELESFLEELAPADDPGMGVIMGGLPTAAGCWPMADDASFLPAEMTESDDFVLEEVMDILTAVTQPGHALQHGADVGVSAPAPAHVPAAPSVVKLEVSAQGAVPYAHAHGLHSMVLVEGEGSPAHGASKEPAAALHEFSTVRKRKRACKQRAKDGHGPESDDRTTQAPPAKKSRSGRSTAREAMGIHGPGPRKDMNVPMDLQYTYHLGVDEKGKRLVKGAKKAMAKEFKTRTDCMSSHVQSSFLRKEVLRRLKPEFLNTGLLYEKGCATSRPKTLELNKRRLMAEKLFTWHAFEARYLMPAST